MTRYGLDNGDHLTPPFIGYRVPTSAESDNTNYFDLVPAGGYPANQRSRDQRYSWFTATDSFPKNTTAETDNGTEVEGRLICLTGNKVYMQQYIGSDTWVVAAEFDDASFTTDPSFIRVSPDGEKIAIGAGYGKPLYIVPTGILNTVSIPDLLTNANVKKFPKVNYYDAEWVDNRYMVINGGNWPVSGGSYASGVGIVDIQDSDPANHEGMALVTNIGGSSADVHVDQDKNLITGIGYATSPNRTGEIKVWEYGAGNDWSLNSGDNLPPHNGPLDYEANIKKLANNILSAAYLDHDHAGNLTVGGGDAFGVGGPSENGYAAVVTGGIVTAVADGTRTTPVDENAIDEYGEIAPDPCRNDTATGIIANNWGQVLGVIWNPATLPPNCNGTQGSATEYWLPGVNPRMSIYVHDDSPDTDNDGVFDFFGD